MACWHSLDCLKNCSIISLQSYRFKVLCCKSPNHRTTDCYTQILNDFRAVIDYTVPEDHVIVGFYSYHRNDKEYV